MFSTEPIAAFLDLCPSYIFGCIWVNKNVDGCLKWVYNIDRYTPESNHILSFFEEAANIVSLGMRIDIDIRFTPLSSAYLHRKDI